MSTTPAPQTALATTPKGGVLARFAESYDLDPGKVMNIVSSTVFRAGKDEPALSNEEVAAAIIVCNNYQLNPFTKEIYAFRSKGKLLIVVSVDGWSTIVNRQPQLNGIEFEEHFDDKGNIKAVTCKIHRKDRALPTVVTEWTHECKRNTDPWNNMPIRMTRNRAFVQCARIAFSISGIVDEDEAQTIEGSPVFHGSPIEANIDTSGTRTETVKQAIQHRKQRGANGAQAGQAAPEAQLAQGAQQPIQDAQQATQASDTQPAAQAQQPTQDQPEQAGSLW